ncbi:hypothetical protein EDD21DRAFT_420351 [Dissophora ornata]|nr:hypothetical protein EDD21DRAFT_420351 [Dissophora ornata]
MDTDQSNQTPPLPSKLRWRPYANGSSKKNSKKRDDARAAQGPDPRATAHKLKARQYYSGKPQNAPVGIKLQWEEAETIQSMSHGGHPHNQHDSDRSRDSSPSASSVTSSSSETTGRTRAPTYVTNSNNVFGDYDNTATASTSTNSNPFTNALLRALGSLPSPPPPKPQNTRLDLVGGQSDLSQFKATIPGMTGNGLLQNGQQLSTMAPDTAYQIALNALLQSQSIKNTGSFLTPALIGGNDVSNGGNAPMTNTNTAAPAVSVTLATTSVSALLGSSNIGMFLSDPDRVLSSQELLGVSSIDELLSSCGYLDSSNSFLSNPAAQMLASPANTDQSLNASPMTGLLDYSNTGNVSRATSPSSGSFSPMALNSAAFEALLAQPVVPQRPGQQQQRPIGVSPAMSNVSTSVASDPYDSLLQELASPFGYISVSGDSALSNAPTAWPSLFPAAVDDQVMNMNSTGTTVALAPQPISERVEIATQTDGPYETPLSPISTKTSSGGSLQGSPYSALGLSSEEELDPDWLSFLDEASPLFNEVDMPSPPPSGDESTFTPIADVKPTTRDRGMWSWAEDLLKPTPNSNYGFPSAGPTMSGMPNGSISNGGLIRTLQGTSQQKSSNRSAPRAKAQVEDTGDDEAATSAKLEAVKKERQVADSKNENKSGVEKKSDAELRTSSAAKEKNERDKLVGKKDEGFGGLVAMIRGLWIGGNGRDEK